MFFGVLWVGRGRGGEGERDLVVPIVGTMTWGYYKRVIISFLRTCTCVKVGFYSYAKDVLLLVALVTIQNYSKLACYNITVRKFLA